MAKEVRGWMGCGTVGGGDPDDADRYPECEKCRGAERPCGKCMTNTPSPEDPEAREPFPVRGRVARNCTHGQWSCIPCKWLDGLPLEKLQASPYAAELGAATKPALAIIAELCSAIETHPRLNLVNEYVENARKRARDFLEANK